MIIIKAFFEVYYFKPQIFSKSHVGRCLTTEIDQLLKQLLFVSS